MAKEITSKFGSWSKNFGDSVKYTSVEIMSELMPNSTATMSSAKSGLESMKSIQNTMKNKSSLQKLENESKHTASARKIKEIFGRAAKDIKDGNFAMNKIDTELSSVYNPSDIENFDFDLGVEDPVAMIGQIAKPIVASQALGAKSTAAAISSMANMNANVSIKSTDILSKTINSNNMLALAQMSDGFNRTNSLLANIDINIQGLVSFASENIGVTNQASMDFMTRMDESMNLMNDYFGKFIKEDKSYSSDNPNDLFTTGMDFGNYGKYVKKRVNEVIPVDMVKMILGTAEVGGGGILGQIRDAIEHPIQAAFKVGMKSLIPKSVRGNMSDLDKALPKYMRHALYNLGDASQNSDNLLAQLFGTFFGIQSPKMKSVDLNTYDKNAVQWDGYSKKALEEVIPSLLNDINVSINRGNGMDTSSIDRSFDYSSGIFKTKKRIKAEYGENLTNTLEMAMTDFVSAMEDKMSEIKVSSGMSDEKYGSVNKEVMGLVNSYISHNINNSDAVIKPTDKDKIAKFAKKNSKYGNAQSAFIQAISSLSSRDSLDFMQSVRDGRDSQNKIATNLADGHEDGGIFRSLFLNDEDSLGMDEDTVRAMKFLTNGMLGQRSAQDEEVIDGFGANDSQKQKQIKELQNKLGAAINGFIPKNRKKDGRITNKINATIGGIDNRLMNLTTGNFGAISDDIKGNLSKFKNGVDNATAGAKEFFMGGQLNQEVSQPNKDLRKKHHYTPARKKRGKNSPNQKYKLDDMREDSRNGSGVESDNTKNFSDSDKIMYASDQMVNAADEQTGTFKKLIFGLYDGFLKPAYDGIFGEKGIIKKFLNDDKVKAVIDKVKLTLFGEEDKATKAYKGGPLSNFANSFLDGIDYMKYTFTGKAYKNRKGESFTNKDDSVASHLKKGLSSIYDNTMKFMFGDKFKDNKFFKQTFGAVESLFSKKDSSQKKDATSSLQGAKTEFGTKIINDIENKTKGYSKNQTLKQMKENKSGHGDANRGPRQRGNSTKKNKDQMNQSDDDAAAASQTVGDIISGTTKSVKANFGKFDSRLEEFFFGTSDSDDDDTKNIFTELKAKLPKLATGAVVGAGIPLLAGGSMGLLGGLFLPGGPLGGAIVGMGASWLLHNEKFQKLLFGDKDQDGKRVGGLINKELMGKFKAAIPTIIGGATLGVVKNAMGLGSLPGGLGILSNILLPGGPLGGALLGMGTSLLIRNKTFQEMLYGKEDKDGKRMGGILSKVSGDLSAGVKKNAGFLKGGLKGALMGGVSAAVIGNMGFLGAALTVGGPIGGAIAGTALGIASQTETFKEYLFGSKDIMTGKRHKNGLFAKFAAKFDVNILEPLKLDLQDAMHGVASWIKKDMMIPFRLAFGPIIDSFKFLQKNITTMVKDTFILISDGVVGFLKKAIEPITNFAMNWILKPMMGFVKNIVKFGAVSTGAVLSAPLKALSLLTAPKRMKKRLKFGGDYLLTGEAFTDLSNDWKAKKENGTAPRGLNGILSKGTDIVQTMMGRSESYLNAEENVAKSAGEDSLDWMRAVQDKRGIKKDDKAYEKEAKKKRESNKLRKSFMKEERYIEHNMTDEEYDSKLKRMKKAGLDTKYVSDKDKMNKFTYHRDDYDKYVSDKISLENKSKEESDKLTRETTEMHKENKEFHGDVSTGLGNITALISEQLEIAKDLKNPRRKGRKKYNGGAPSTENFISVDDKKAGLDPDIVSDKEENDIANQASATAKGVITALSDQDKKNAAKNKTKELQEKAFNTDKKSTKGEASDALDTKSGIAKESVGLLGSLLGDGGLLASGLATLVAGFGASVLAAYVLPKAMDFAGEALGITDNNNNRTTEKGSIVSNGNFGEAMSGVVNNKLAISMMKYEPSKKSTSLALKVGEKITRKLRTSVGNQSTKLFNKFWDMFFGIFNKVLNSKMIKKLMDAPLIGKVFKALESGVAEILTNPAGLATRFNAKIKSGMAKILAGSAEYIPFVGQVLMIGSASYDVVTGFLDAANLFSVEKEDVDGSMRIVSAIFKVLLGIGNFGPILDIGLEIIQAVSGIDGKKLIANILYSAITFGDAEKINALKASQVEFSNEWESYNQENGTNLTLDAYNDMTNKTAGSKIVDGFKGIFKGKDTDVKVATNASDSLNMYNSGETSAVGFGNLDDSIVYGYGNIDDEADPLSNTMDYISAKSTEIGVFDSIKNVRRIASSNSKLINQLDNPSHAAIEYLTKIRVDRSVTNLSQLSIDHKIALGQIQRYGYKTKYNKAANIAGDILGNIRSLFNTFFDKLGKMTFIKKIFTASRIDIIKATFDDISAKLVDGIQAGSAHEKNIIKFFKKNNIFKLLNGLNIASVIWETISGVYEAGELFRVNPKNVSILMRGISGILNFLMSIGWIGPILSILFSLINSIFKIDARYFIAVTLYKILAKSSDRDKLIADQKNLERELVEYNSSNNTKLTIDDYIDFVNPSLGSIIAEKFKDGSTKIYDYVKQSIQINNSKDVASIGYGADGNHFSQTDSKWKDVRIGTLPNGMPSTMQDGGCGPTALATAASYLGNKSVNPTSVASMAVKNGYIVKGGSSADLFNQGASQLGLSSNQLAPKDLSGALRSGNPVIVSGKGKNGIYSNAGHIITATGMDSNGNVSINDPLKKKSSSVPFSKLSNGVTGAWKISNAKGGYGSGNISSSPNSVEGYGLWNKFFDDVGTMDKAAKEVGILKDYSFQASLDRVTNPKKDIWEKMDIMNNAAKEVGLIRDNNLQSRLDKNKPKIDTNISNQTRGIIESQVAEKSSDGLDFEYSDEFYNLVKRNGAVYYSQTDPLWKDKHYGDAGDTEDTIGNIGCIMTSLAMALSSMTGQVIDPAYLVDRWGQKYWTPDQGVDHKMFPQVAKDLGVTVTDQLMNTNAGKEEIYTMLQRKIPVVLFGNKGGSSPYGSKSGGTHSILATGLNEKGEVMINDPGKNASSTTGLSYSYDNITKYLRWAYGVKNPNAAGGEGGLLSMENLGDFTVPESSTFANANVDETTTTETNPFNMLAGLLLNRLKSGLSGDDYSSIFDSNGKYTGTMSSITDLMTGIFGTGESTMSSLGNSIVGAASKSNLTYNPLFNESASQNGVYKGIGNLLENYESGGNIGSVSMDSNGHYAMGKYQFNTAWKNPDYVLSVIKDQFPEFYNSSFKGIDTIGTNPNSSIRNMWANAATGSYADQFEKAQDIVAYNRYLSVAMTDFEKKFGISTNSLENPYAIKEALLSAAIQHGAGTPGEWIKGKTEWTEYPGDAEFLNWLYNRRATAYSKGTERYTNELSDALAILKKGNSPSALNYNTPLNIADIMNNKTFDINKVIQNNTSQTSNVADLTSFNASTVNKNNMSGLLTNTGKFDINSTDNLKLLKQINANTPKVKYKNIFGYGDDQDKQIANNTTALGKTMDDLQGVLQQSGGFGSSDEPDLSFLKHSKPTTTNDLSLSHISYGDVKRAQNETYDENRVNTLNDKINVALETDGFNSEMKNMLGLMTEFITVATKVNKANVQNNNSNVVNNNTAVAYGGSKGSAPVVINKSSSPAPQKNSLRDRFEMISSGKRL